MWLKAVNYPLFRRCFQYVRGHCVNKRVWYEISPKVFFGVAEVFIGTKICCAVISPTKSQKMDIEEVQKALLEGDIAIIKLMDELKDVVKVVSEEYRNCLKKQIEITEKSKNEGPFTKTWDNLPQYRTLATELLQQLNNYKALFDTLGKMAEVKFSVSLLTENNIFAKISQKFKESQEVIQHEFEENHKLEMKLLKLTCNTIIMDGLSNSNDET